MNIFSALRQLGKTKQKSAKIFEQGQSASGGTMQKSEVDKQTFRSWIGCRIGFHSACTTCGLSSLANFLKVLYSCRVCCVFRNIRDNQGFWSKTAVFSLSATKVHCLLIFWLPHLYNLLQPGSRKQHKYTSIHEYRY